jgi:hypothetical protein
MHPGAVLVSLLSLAFAAGIWCWSRYEMRRHEHDNLIAIAEVSSKLREVEEAAASERQKFEKDNSGLRQQLAEAIEAAKPPPTPDEVTARILAIRELVFRRTPKWTASTAEEIMKRLSARAVASLTPEVAEARMRASIAMGFVTSPFDYREAIASLATMKSGGFYEPETGRFYYQADASLARADSREVFAGAVLPVLLAQNFGDAAPPPEPDSDDAALAAQALAFGDASFTRVRFSIGDQSHANFDRGQPPAAPMASPNAPQFLTEMWKWSEDSGNLFVQTLHGKGGLTAINKAYQRPPQSSAEIMHAEQLYLAEPPFVPVKVSFPDTAVGGTEALHTNVAGEIGSYFLIRTFADMDYATLATEGWAGDRYVVWPGSKEHGDHLLWRSVWMTDEDAKQFFAAMRRGVMQRHLIPWQKEYDVSPDEFRIDDPHRIVRLRRDGKTVTLVSATDSAFARVAEEKFPPGA